MLKVRVIQPSKTSTVSYPVVAESETSFYIQTSTAMYRLEEGEDGSLWIAADGDDNLTIHPHYSNAIILSQPRGLSPEKLKRLED